ncbi:hypothetical protein CTER_1548 [Ruminiclostridium cellobioparum subsp. termitidis CT1112]|jgi:hypothetical protein|uniref:Uncharacterized protein n=2 Tax=Ruminiclostridium cellobioparum TaxID=29355 RepID=S0FLC5_RUMCE|nr:hypothetical protein CTER_1548 [Ruminiclostridium cellobioparum subsp. termitidis CT1112]
MFDTLLQHSIFQKVIMNTLLVSIPEEFYFVMFVLILVGEFEYWKEPGCKRLINKFDYFRVFLPTGVVALLSNILRYNGLEGGIYQFIPPVVLYILIVLTNDIFGDASCMKWMGKAFIFLLIGFISIGLSEFIYMPFVLYSTGLTMEEICNDFRLYFGLSLPARVLQYSILLYFVCRKRTLLKGQMFKHIFSNTKLSVIFSLFGVFNIAFMFVMYKAVVYDKALVAIPLATQFVVVIGIVLFPIANIISLLLSSYYIRNLEVNDKKGATDKLESLYKEIQLYTNNGEYDNIMWKLNEFGIGIKEVSNSLYKGNTTDYRR